MAFFQLKIIIYNNASSQAHGTCLVTYTPLDLFSRAIFISYSCNVYVLGLDLMII